MSEPNALSEAQLIASLPQLPCVAGKPVFAEDWEARAFALAVALSKQGHFTWDEWIAGLSSELKAATSRGEPNDPPHYYRRWLAALEHLITAKGLIDPVELLERMHSLAEPVRRPT